MVRMARLFFLLVVTGTLTAACSANTATEELPTVPMRADAVTPAAPPAPVLIPDNPADRTIRRDLALAIASDADLQHRDISFNVTNGDVSVTGIVRTEEERRKINGLAMSLDGVKSVANALRVAE
jgi:BON domain